MHLTQLTHLFQLTSHNQKKLSSVLSLKWSLWRVDTVCGLHILYNLTWFWGNA